MFQKTFLRIYHIPIPVFLSNWTDLSFIFTIVPPHIKVNYFQIKFFCCHLLQNLVPGHTMARANLNKSVWLVTNTTTASKYIPKKTRICINWNSPFQTKIYLVKVPLSVNIVKQDLLHKKQFLKILWRKVWKGGFQLMLILDLLGMYFDALVLFVTSQTLLFRLALAILWRGTRLGN